MTHPRNSTTLDQLMELLIQDGPDAMADAFTTLLNHAMRIEREQADAAVGDRYNTEAYRRAVTYGIKAANKALAEKLGRPLEPGEGVPDWTPHQLRHSAATRLRKDHDIEAARLVLGHTSAAVTEIYAEIDKAKARQIRAEAG